MPSADIVVVGGGIAGTSTALSLARRGAGRVLLLEQEATLASHSTGRNAAIWLPVEGDETTVELSTRSERAYEAIVGPAWCRRTGGLVVASSAAALETSERGASARNLSTLRVEAEELAHRSPPLAGSAYRFGLAVDEGGELDIHAIAQGIAAAARAAGVTVRARTPIAAVRADRRRVTGVELRDGSTIDAGEVVIASGAWAAGHGASCGAPLPLVALRRHLVLLDVERPGLARTPIVWSVGDEAYFRPESGGLLASPCDETPVAACLPVVDPSAVESLARKLRRVAPALVGSGVRSSWACLRTFAADGEVVCGRDPRLEGLAWTAGLGGRGMTVGLAAGEVTAAAIVGDEDPALPRVSPERLLRR